MAMVKKHYELTLHCSFAKTKIFYTTSPKQLPTNTKTLDIIFSCQNTETNTSPNFLPSNFIKTTKPQVCKPSCITCQHYNTKIINTFSSAQSQKTMQNTTQSYIWLQKHNNNYYLITCTKCKKTICQKNN